MARIDQSRQQVLNHVLRRNTWAIAAVACFICAVASTMMLNLIDPKIALALIAVFAIATVVCAFQIKETGKTEKFSVKENTKPLEMLPIANSLSDGFALYGRDGGRLRGDTDACFVMSHEVNRLFTTRPLWVTIPNELYHLPDGTIPYTAYLKENRDKELSKYAALRPDKAVMSLHSDIDLKLFESEHPTVIMKKVSRYAVQVSDDAFNKIIVNKANGNEIVFNGRSQSIAENGSLLSLANATGANEVDIHSLIISSDGYIMFARGTAEHPLRPDKVIASAACSLLPSELQKRPVQESMIDSIHNKIKELYDIPAGTDMKSSFCGFARILQRGGAPEFYCLTRIDMTKNQLIKAHNDPTSEFIDDILMAMVPDLENVEDAARYIADAVNVLRKAVEKDISISGSAMLNAITDAMCDKEMSEKVLLRTGVIAGYVPSSQPRGE